MSKYMMARAARGSKEQRRPRSGVSSISEYAVGRESLRASLLTNGGSIAPAWLGPVWSSETKLAIEIVEDVDALPRR